MVEGARLESVCTLIRTEGSNPSLSATQSELWRQSPQEIVNNQGIQKDTPLDAAFFLPVPELLFSQEFPICLECPFGQFGYSQHFDKHGVFHSFFGAVSINI